MAEAPATPSKPTTSQGAPSAAPSDSFVNLLRNTNILEELPNYSYHISLRAYKTSFESQLNDDKSITPKSLEDNTTVIAASGGTAQYPNRVGLKDQKGDVFIKSLTMTSANGLAGGGSGRISPVTEIRLNVVETGGVEFLGSLMASTAILDRKEKAKEVNLTAEAPFLLTIEFNATGTDTATREKILKRTKHLKVRVTKCNFSIRATGVEYELMCIPFHTFALTDTAQANAVNQSYTIKGPTMQDYINEIKAALDKTEEVTKNGVTYNFKFLGKRAQEFAKATLNATALNRSDTNLDSLPFKSVQGFLPKEGDTTQANADSQNSARAEGATDQNKSAEQGQTREITVPQNVGIPTLIERLCMNSTFLAESFKDPKDPPAYVPFIRVIPMVVSDRTQQEDRNVVKKTITFNIIVIEIPVISVIKSTNKDAAAKALAKLKQQTVRSYRYLFTGGNKSILNFDLRYDYLFTKAFSVFNANVQNQGLNDRSGTNVDPASDKAPPADPTQAKTADSKVEAPKPSDNQQVPAVATPTPGGETESGFPVDYEGTAKKFRELLPEIFNNQQEKATVRANIEVVGDPDLISEVDNIKSQESLEKAIEQMEANNSSQAVNSLTSPVNAFEPYYFMVEIGNRNGKSFGNIHFGGYYMPLKITHNFPENGRYTTTLDVARIQGIDLKTKDNEPKEGAKDVVSKDEAATKTTKAPEQPAGAKTGLNSVTDKVSSAKDATTAGIKDTANKAAENKPGVATQVPLPGTPGNTPPKNIPTGAATLAQAVPLPSTTAGAKTAEAAAAAVDKNVGAILDTDPVGDNKQAPPPNPVFAGIAEVNKLSGELQKLSATAGNIQTQLAGEVNNMVSGLAEKAGKELSAGLGKAMNSLKGGIASAKSSVKIPGPAASVLGGGATASASGGPTVGLTNVTEAAQEAAKQAAPAVQKLKGLVSDFQLPGFPAMTSVTKKELQAVVAEAGKIEVPPIDLTTGMPKLPADAAGAAAGALDKVKGAAGALTDAAAGAASKLTAGAKDALGKLKGKATEAAATAAAAAPQPGALAAGEAKVAAPFTPDQIKDASKKFAGGLAAGLKEVTGALQSVDTKEVFGKAASGLKEAVSGAGLKAPNAASAIKDLKGAANTLASTAQKAAPALASAGQKALSGITAAASKGLGGSSLSDKVKEAGSKADSALSGLANEVKKITPPPIISGSLAGAEGAVAGAISSAQGQLAKISEKTILSTPGLSELPANQVSAFAERLSKSNLASAGGLPGVPAGVVKIEGLNEIVPPVKLDPSGVWKNAQASASGALDKAKSAAGGALDKAKSKADSLTKQVGLG